MYDTSQIETPFLEVRDLELRSDGVSLISVPELSLKCTSITVIMGSNGAGKSLLLRLMHGLIQPAHGEISCWGTPLSPSTRRSQSLVFQTPVLLRRTTEANVRFVLKARGLDVRTSGELLERVGLAEKARTPARRLSGGERQRLAIAQALATKPKTLLLDEPTASLDPRSTAMIEDILRQTISLGTRILMVTHDAMQAKRMAEEIVFLSDGKVIEQSPAAQFFKQPKTEQARAYLAGRLSA